MFGRWINRSLILIAAAVSGCATDERWLASAAPARERALKFLKREVPAWSRANACFSCHNNGDAARALYLASRLGYPMPVPTLADTTTWVSQPARWDDNPGDPGFSDKRLANIQFAAALLAAIDAGQVGRRAPLEEAARKLAADQGPDGSWAIEETNALGSPATYGTPLATLMALRTLKRAALPETMPMIQKAEDWLRRMPVNNTVAAAALLLASEFVALSPDDPRRGQSLALIRRAQSSDGGFGPYPDSPPEPFDTAMVLLALRKETEAVGMGELIRRGQAFLLRQQNPDGSWPATTRPPGGTSYAQRVSTTAWVTLALLPAKDPGTKAGDTNNTVPLPLD